MKKTTLATLKAAIRKTGREIGIDEDPPHEMNNEGYFDMHLVYPDGAKQSELEQFKGNGCSCYCVPYYEEDETSREEAIKFLIECLAEGFEPMGDETAHAQGI